MVISSTEAHLMRESKYSLLLVSSQPIQNAAPLQIMARDDRVEVLTAYCSLPDKRLWRDHESLTREAFDIPLLDGYAWRKLRNYSPMPRLGKFYGLINPGIVRLVSNNDCCVVFGHSYISFWLAIAAAKLCGKPLLLTTDATYLDSQYGGSWKTSLKKKFLPYLYNRIADMVLVPSTASCRFVRSLGVDEGRVVITPYVVDNDYIAAVAARTDRGKVREEWRVPDDATVMVFCAKFLARKRPQDALRAFARANVPNSYLVMVGDGPLGDSLKSEAEQLGITSRVRFPGLVKYSRLPEAYAASDVLVFPSEHEPYGLPVNEAMICGIPAIVSDRVGAGFDLVEHGKTGFVYPSGDVDGLASILREVLPDRELLRRLGDNARERMQTWSPRENAEATVKAAEAAIASRQARR
jgi:glycosyltransferase involved in cell wall biosynthesis